MIDDAWLSLVERCVRDAEVAGSNPVASTYYSHLFEVAFLVPATGSGPNFGRRGPWRSGGPPFRADRSGAQTAGSNPVASTYYSHLYEVAFLVPATGSGPHILIAIKFPNQTLIFSQYYVILIVNKRSVTIGGYNMKTTEQQHIERKNEIMEKCFECYAENGLTGTGIKALADACGCTKANLYSYFKNLDELIIESTAYCMSKVEDDFMQKAPTDPKDVMRFIEEVPYWTAKKHGSKYRLMYQVYTLPKYIEHGKKFFEGVNERYTEYAKLLEPKIGIPYTTITPLIFIFVRACVHYAMFEDEYYLKTQMEVLKQGVSLFIEHYKK